MMRALFRLAAPVTMALALAGCGKPKGIYADHAYVRLPAVKGNPAVAYFTLHGGAQDTALLSVMSPVAIKAEMHESMSSGSMASMAPIAHVPLPASGALEFKPGGKHVMLHSLNPAVEVGGTIPLVFTFANNDRVRTDAHVIAAGDAPPKD